MFKEVEKTSTSRRLDNGQRCLILLPGRYYSEIKNCNNTAKKNHCKSIGWKFNLTRTNFPLEFGGLAFLLLEFGRHVEVI